MIQALGSIPLRSCLIASANPRAALIPVSFLPMECDLDNKAMVKPWVDAGFDNYDNDLFTKIWMFKASRSTAAVIGLKELYTAETRKELARILHRIEFGVKCEENLSALWKLAEKEMIFPDYLLGFIEEVSFNKKDLLNVLFISAKNKGLENYAAEIGEAIR